MTIPVEIEGADNEGRVLRQTMIKRNGEQGPVVFIDPLREYEANTAFAFNRNFGIEMARDFSFTGTPVGVHNGIDSTLWTAVSVIGTKYTFNSTDQFNSGAASVKSNKASVGNVMEFDRGSNLDLSNYVAITMYIYVDNGWSPSNTDSMSVCGWDTATLAIVGVAVRIEDYFNETEFGIWQKVTIPLGDMALSGETIDAIRIEVIARSGGGPLYYIDDFQIENTGGSEIFKAEAPRGKKFLVESLSFLFIDALDTTLASNSMPNLSYDKILGLPTLPNGIVFQRTSKGEVLFSANIKSISDSIRSGGNLKNIISDGTNTSITLETVFMEPLVLDARKADAISIIISDDLSGLISFTAVFRGKTRDT